MGKKLLYETISSGKTTGILLAVLAIALASATFVENILTTEIARRYIYNSPLMFILMTFIALNFITLIIKRNYFRAKRYGMMVLHIAFIVIMLGAAITHFCSLDGYISLRKGQSTSLITDSNAKQIGKLPFDITLDEFRMEKYSSLGTARSYESHITMDGRKFHVFMNGFVKYRHYRLYQSSYDSDLQGSILSVSHDPWGITITYIGYILLLIGFIWSMAEKGSRTRTLIRQVSASVIIPAVLLSSTVAAFAGNEMQSVKQSALHYSTMYAVPDSIADNFARLSVQTAQGRIEPIDTYSRDILQKISKQTSFNSLSSSKVLMGICTQPEIWTYVPFVRISGNSVSRLLSLDVREKYASYSDAFDRDGNYILDKIVQGIYAKNPKDRTGDDKDILKFDERLNILSSLLSGKSLNIFPLEGTNDWYSGGDDLQNFQAMDSVFVANAMKYISSEIGNALKSRNWDKTSELIGVIGLYQQKKGSGSNLNKTNAEILYNRLNAVRISGYGLMTFGIILIIITVLAIVLSKKMKFVQNLVSAAAFIIFMFLTFSLALRWYISGNAPWSNAYESIVYVGWATALIGFCARRHSEMVYSLATFFSGAILFVTNLSLMDPQITPLVPVLRSYWLIIHVATITASYSFFGICALIGTVTMIVIAVAPKKRNAGVIRSLNEFTSMNELLMWIGLALMTIGTFLGAVWANQSWGRYWGWDPKETWALITVIVYAIVLHVRLITSRRSQLVFAVLSTYALGTVLMTFFGVNYYLTGLHSYAGGTSPIGLKVIWIAYAAVSAIAIAAYLRNSKEAEKSKEVQP